MNYIVFRIVCYVLVVIGSALFMIYDHDSPWYWMGIFLIVVCGLLAVFPQILLFILNLI